MSPGFIKGYSNKIDKKTKIYDEGQHTPFFESIIVVNSLRIIAFTRTINIDAIIIQNNVFQSWLVMCAFSNKVMITRNRQNK